jgi:UPF0271 protein
MHDPVQAQAVVEGVSAWRSKLPLLGLPDSELLRRARLAGLPAVAEGYADRAYTAEGRLVPRKQAGAVIHDPDAAAHAALRLARAGRIRTICVHGDTPGAVEMARRVRAALEAEGLLIGAFA